MQKAPETGLTAPEIQVISAVVREMMAPVMENIGTILERNSQAMERIAATQQMMSQRISDLEKQVRLKTPMSKAQEKCVNEAIRARAREIMEGKGYGEDKKAITRLAGQIRKSVLARYGVDTLREAPAYDYETALAQARSWNDLLAIRDAAKEARKRAEMAERAAEGVRNTDEGQRVDGGKAVARPDHQPGEPDQDAPLLRGGAKG